MNEFFIPGVMYTRMRNDVRQYAFAGPALVDANGRIKLWLYQYGAKPTTVIYDPVTSKKESWAKRDDADILKDWVPADPLLDRIESIETELMLLREMIKNDAANEYVEG